MANLNTVIKSYEDARKVSAWFTPLDDKGQPHGDPPFRIHLLSRKSDEWRQLERAWQAGAVVRRANDQPLTVRDANSYEQHLLKSHIAITLEWENLTTDDGSPVPVSPVTLTNLYSDLDFQEQLYRFTANPKNYGMAGDVEPQTEEEDAEKKSESGANGASLSATTSQ